MSVEEAAGWVEVVKAIGTALGVLIGAVGLAYGRIAAVQAKQAAQQTKTDPYVGGKVEGKSVATSAEQALATAQQALETVQQAAAEARGAREDIQALLAREKTRGTGARRVHTAPQPDLSSVQQPAEPEPAAAPEAAVSEPYRPPAPAQTPAADTAMFARLDPPSGT